MTARLWVSWPRATRAHAAVRGVDANGVRVGSFPLVCGQWAPDAWDADVTLSSKPHCGRCQRIVNREIEGGER